MVKVSVLMDFLWMASGPFGGLRKRTGTALVKAVCTHCIMGQMQKRKPQARSLQTRQRLRDAAIDTIVEVGLPKASTPRINEKAGVSNGAQQHYYPTRSDLIISSLEELTNEYTGQLEGHLEHISPGGAITDVLRLIASSARQHHRYRLCWNEAMIAARTSPELAEALRPLGLAKNERLKNAAITVAEGNEEQVADIAELTIYLVRGMALQQSLHPDADYERLLNVWCGMAESVLARG